MGEFRIQDIIGLILAILIVAILISIILILRESARERRRWVSEEEEEEEVEKGAEKRRFPFSSREVTRGEGGVSGEVIRKKKWSALPRPMVTEEKEEVIEKAEVPEEKTEEEIEEHRREERVIQEEVEKELAFKESQKTKEEGKKGKEPKQVVIERALRKLEDQGIDFGKLKPFVTEEMLSFSPLLWEVKEEVRSGKELGEIVVHTVFRTIPGYSGEEIVERYRSGAVSYTHLRAHET
ncbi:MAG: hypothetical protein N2Z84_03965, partial [Atribacterota bacterium]|nr:hypothetical protein [Atribacterota bacterium]